MPDNLCVRVTPIPFFKMELNLGDLCLSYVNDLATQSGGSKKTNHNKPAKAVPKCPARPPAPPSTAAKGPARPPAPPNTAAKPKGLARPPAPPSTAAKVAARPPAPPSTAAKSKGSARPPQGIMPKSGDFTHRQIPVAEYTPNSTIRHPKHEQHVAKLQRAIDTYPALKLTVKDAPTTHELNFQTKVRVSPAMLKGKDATERAWQLGNAARGMKTLPIHGTPKKTKIHPGMAVLNAPEYLDDPWLIERGMGALDGFFRGEEAHPNRSITFSGRGADGKLMIGYNHKKDDEMEQGPDGTYRHVQYAETASKTPSNVVNLHYVPTIADVLAELPEDTFIFIVMYLKGLCELYECSTDQIFNWSIMLLDYIKGGGFASHTDGVKAFNNQAGFVNLLSLCNQAKHFDLIPVSTLSEDKPIRITTNGYESIVMTGKPRVDEPHAVPFDDIPKKRTLAIKMPFILSTAKYIYMERSELSGIYVQKFDAKAAIKAGKGAVVFNPVTPAFLNALSVDFVPS